MSSTPLKVALNAFSFTLNAFSFALKDSAAALVNLSLKKFNILS